MTALSAARDTSYQRERGFIEARAMAGSLTVHQGGLAVRNAAGYVTKGSTALALVGIGRFYEGKVNAGSNGDEKVRVEEGIFNFANSASGDLIAIADVGKVCFIVDDQTVAKTSASGTRSPAGIVRGVDSNLGVWVEVGDGVLAAWLAARKKLVPLRLTTIAGSGSPAYRTISPFSGLVTKITSIVELALTTADATLTAAINGVGITNGVLTVTQAGSAAGDIDTATPTAANYVTAGQELKVTVTGTQAAAAPANVTFEIDAD